MRWLDDITKAMDMNLSKLQKLVTDSEACIASMGPWGHEEWDTTEQVNWTELKGIKTSPGIN